MPELRTLLKSFDFPGLFLQIGWDHFNLPLSVAAAENTFQLQGVAEKFGVQVYHCAGGDNGRIPPYALRKKIEQEVTKRAFEHLIIFSDATKSEQVWQWVARLPGTPIACREYHFRVDQSGEAIVQKLHGIRFRLDEEETLTLFAVKERLRDTFDREKVTKTFYKQFEFEHRKFQTFIDGITSALDKKWYASLMLNRLMFVYFIQEKGFLDGNKRYLRTKLDQVQTKHGKDKFHTFYRLFLLRLFHEGLGMPESERKKRAGLDALLGRVPYLNGGLFQVHEIEERNPDIQIPDEAFERIFDFFDDWHWHLDDRPIASGKEINPDVLGYIFEQYINQKQMGAYYTKEDITEYIARNCILPFLFDTARMKCKVAFEGDNSIWRLLRENPAKYIFPALSHGVDEKLPGEIAAGIKDSSQRDAWGKPADLRFGLPTETWREVIARRAYCKELKQKLAGGDVRDINDLITLNLDIRQFAQDVIQESEGPEFVRAFWRTLVGYRPEKQTEQPTLGLSVLDPTCGSGAFLFAALNVLKPLYDACLQRMDAFVADADRIQTKSAQPKFADFRTVLADVDDPSNHPNRDYFVLKSIILSNLYGVDIMREAVEICKLRLFLKLAAQVDKDDEKANFGLEPLPDVDFNIRAGNTLVGYATKSEVEHAMTAEQTSGQDQMKLGVSDEKAAFESFNRRCADVEQTFEAFRRYQLRGDGTVPPEHKLKLRDKLRALEKELNHFLARESFVNPSKEAAYEKWLDSHQPFHWFVEFYGIMQNGGFDIAIGNPPYISAAKVTREYRVKGFRTSDCTDIYAWVLERTHALICDGGRSGMIVPLSLGFSSDFDPCRKLLFNGYSHNWFSSFGRIPSALFNFDVRVRNTIHVGCKSQGESRNYTTRLHRWFEAARPMLFQGLTYAPFQPKLWKGRIPKLNTPRLAAAFEQLLQSTHRTLDSFTSFRATKHVLHFKKTAYNWLNFCRTLPPCYDLRGNEVGHTQFGEIFFSTDERRDLAMLLTNGKLMFIYWCAVGDDFHVANWNFGDFPIDLFSFEESANGAEAKLAGKLESAMSNATQFKLNAGRKVGNYNLAKCRAVTDISDEMLIKKLQMPATLDDLDLYYTQVVKTDFDDEEE